MLHVWHTETILCIPQLFIIEYYGAEIPVYYIGSNVCVCVYVQYIFMHIDVYMYAYVYVCIHYMCVYVCAPLNYIHFRCHIVSVTMPHLK